MIKVTSNMAAFKRMLDKSSKAVPQGMRVGLGKWAQLASKASKGLLSGSGSDAAGAYPVPVRSGYLRRLEDYIVPGRSKFGVTARKDEAFLINPTVYARTIHEGGRPFQKDAIKNTRKQGVELMRVSVRQALAKAWS